MKTIDFGTRGEGATVNGAGAAYGCPTVSVQVVLTGGEACIRIQLCLDPHEAEIDRAVDWPAQDGQADG